MNILTDKDLNDVRHRSFMDGIRFSVQCISTEIEKIDKAEKISDHVETLRLTSAMGLNSEEYLVELGTTFEKVSILVNSFMNALASLGDMTKLAPNGTVGEYLDAAKELIEKKRKEKGAKC